MSTSTRRTAAVLVTLATIAITAMAVLVLPAGV